MNRPDNRSFLIAGVIIALTIGILSVFFSSGDPDGLESTALMIQGEKSLTGPAPAGGDPEAIGTGVSVYSSPFPDYAMGKELGPLGGAVATVLGILVMLAVVLGVMKIIQQKKTG